MLLARRETRWRFASGPRPATLAITNRAAVHWPISTCSEPHRAAPPEPGSSAPTRVSNSAVKTSSPSVAKNPHQNAAGRVAQQAIRSVSLSSSTKLRRLVRTAPSGSGTPRTPQHIMLSKLAHTSGTTIYQHWADHHDFEAGLRADFAQAQSGFMHSKCHTNRSGTPPDPAAETAGQPASLPVHFDRTDDYKVAHPGLRRLVRSSRCPRYSRAGMPLADQRSLILHHVHLRRCMEHHVHARQRSLPAGATVDRTYSEAARHRRKHARHLAPRLRPAASAARPRH